MSETTNVLLRWARLKQEAKTAPSSQAASPGIGSAAPQAGPDAATNEPFDPARLPSIDAMTAGTDIIAFLQSGVPAELTRAALRRAWTCDPAIRNFIGIADNQWDFNDPNGIPGFGPLGSVRGHAACRLQVSRSLKKMLDLPAEEMGPIARESKSGRSEGSAVVQRADRGSDELHSTSISSCDICETHAEAKNEDAAGQYEASDSRRRHGSALPR